MIVGLQANFFDDAQEDKSAVVKVKSRKQGHAENIHAENVGTTKTTREIQASFLKEGRANAPHMQRNGQNSECCARPRKGAQTPEHSDSSPDQVANYRATQVLQGQT